MCILARVFSRTSSDLTPSYLLQEARKCLTLAVQDRDVITSTAHSAQGITYIKLARRMASDSTLEKQSRIIPSELDKLLNEEIEKKRSK